MPIKWTEEQLIEEVPKALNMTDLIRKLGLCPTGGSRLTIKKWIDKLNLDISHFETRKDVLIRIGGIKEKIPLEKILIQNSTYSRCHLKRRLILEGYLKEECSLCGQGTCWQGKKMALNLDHINGVRDDNRINNLRFICPNCDATLSTYCGRKAFKEPKIDKRFKPKFEKRIVKRPPYEILLKEVKELNYCKVGKKYGVSDTAIRKWIKCYEKYGK